MSEQVLRQLSRDYGKLLDELQVEIEKVLGPLLWDPRLAASETVLLDGTEVYRAGEINAIGVRVAEIERGALTKAVNRVLIRHGFPDQPEISGSYSGHLVMQSTDGAGATVNLLVKSGVQAFIDKPKNKRRR